MRRIRSIYCVLIILGISIFSFSNVLAQEQTVGVFVKDTAVADGYVLFAPKVGTTTHLIDNYGREIKTWKTDFTAAATVYLLENGNLLKTTRFPVKANGGGIQEFTWDGTLVWEFEYYGPNYRRHHDIEPLPNGNILILAWDYMTTEEAIAAGRNPDLMSDTKLSPEHIVEVTRTGLSSGEIVWEWHAWDHLIQDFDETKANYGDVAAHPELMDFNYAPLIGRDWLHGNGMDYSPELDQIVISCHHNNELWVIDHSTTTAEAAGHTGGNSGMGGDILYRWGNPLAYRAGTAEDQQLFGQHDTQWIPPGYPGEGNITIYNNGSSRPEGAFSTADEVMTTVDENGQYILPSAGIPHEPAAPTWIYMADPPEDFYSQILSGAHRVKNGNTLICEALSGKFFEVTPSGEIVWEYINPSTADTTFVQGGDYSGQANTVFRCTRIPRDYPGLIGRDLTPGATLERYPVTVSGTMTTPDFPCTDDIVVVSTNVIYETQPALVELYVDDGSGYSAVTMDFDGIGTDDAYMYSSTILPLPGEYDVSYYIKVEINQDTIQFDPPYAPGIFYKYSVPCQEGAGYTCGDANRDGIANVGDAVFMINYVFKNGEAPSPLESGDTNCDGWSNVGDAVYLINFVFKDGPAPCESCP